MLIYPGFDVADLGSTTMTIGGGYTGVATVTSGTFTHGFSLASMVVEGANGSTGGTADAGAILYLKFASTLQTRLQVIDASFTATWDGSTGAYTIAATNAFTISCSAAMNRITGTPATPSATSHVSTTLPYYFLVPAINGRSKSTDLREPDGIAHGSVSDGGTDFVVARDTQELHWDWQHAMEPKAAVLTRFVGGSPSGYSLARSWSWQQFFKHTRGAHPFVVDESAENTVHRLRAEGASMDQGALERVVADYDGLWAVNLKTRYLGRVS